MSTEQPDTPEAPTAATSVTPHAIRDELTDMVLRDLLGPAGGPEEELGQYEDRASNRYLVGMLAPKKTEVAREELDELGAAGTDDNEVGATDASTPAAITFFPSSIGMSFVIEESFTEFAVQAEWGRYKREKSATQVKKDGNPALIWKRYPFASEKLTVPLKEGAIDPIQPVAEDPYVVIQGKVRKSPNGWVVTLFLVNAQDEPDKKKDEAWVFQSALKVTSTGETAQPIFVQRRDWKLDLSKMDPLTREETETLEMLYRRKKEFAVGHGISVHAELPEPEAQQAIQIETKFVPISEVEQQTPPTAEDNADLADVVLDMKELAEMPKADLIANLLRIDVAYGNWIDTEEAKISDPSELLSDHKDAAKSAIAKCRRALERIAEGIQLIEDDGQAEDAFRFANRSMWLQRIHTTYARKVRKGELQAGETVSIFDQPENRTWRLFQLVFVILNLPSVTKLDHPDRSHKTDAVADLLWFATGGGKTEAYLGLTAYTLALRRLQGDIEGRAGDHGIAVFMRYTLRLLTLQQFQRATALICACEHIRKEDELKWGKTHFRLGLWVGSKSTPNTLKRAEEALIAARGHGRPSGSGTPLQIMSCPWCGTPIKEKHVKVYQAPSDIGRCITYCGDSVGQCEFSEAKAPREGLPVMVVDEEIYRRPPSLLIATVDKFAQMPWKGETQMLFGKVNGYCERHGFLSPEVDDNGNHPARKPLPRTSRIDHGPLRPPDLIIQDELHLISGPLGSMVGLYECAVDSLCSWTVAGQTVRPKVIASTATIRRAPDQVRKLFLRKLEVFPPQGTDIKDSFFAMQRPAGEDFPGRRYLGICAIGQRYAVAIIRVYVAYLTAAQNLYDKYDNLADPWMTLVGYFNSIRELAGTRRWVEDTIRMRAREGAERGLASRRIRYGGVEELTSRKQGSAIPGILERLETIFDKGHDAQRDTDRKAGKKPQTRPYDVILATNMISVGVDIERLGLMVVCGQPKTTSEYIQATSRVGRSKQGPGLVPTVYNWARPRDMSHYETFEHYHECFYKHVEALSVTPFAARALDRGLAGVLVALMRLEEDYLNPNKAAGELKDTDSRFHAVIEQLAVRATEAMGDAAEGDRLRADANELRDYWLSRVRAQTDHRLGYASEKEGVVGLLKQAGASKWELFTCLNSLRDVEGTVDLLLDTREVGLKKSSTATSHTED